MYIAKKSGQFGTRENQVVFLTEGKEIPNNTSTATIERWLQRGVIEKISVKAEAPENKSLEAPEAKETKKGRGKKSETEE